MEFLDVILPLPLDSTFTYHIPAALQGKIAVGSRVIVPFGTAKLYTGIVCRLHNDKPKDNFEIKDITESIDSKAVVLPSQLRFWQWMNDYYLCPIGDVMKAALPSGMKIASETKLLPNEDFDNWDKLTPKEVTVFETILQKKIQTVAQLQKDFKDNNLLSTLRSLIGKQALAVKENLRTTFAPKTEVHIRLAKKYRNEQILNELCNQLEKTPKRYALLMEYLKMSGTAAALTLGNPKIIQEVNRTELLKESGVSAAVLSGLRAKGILETYDYEIGRIQTTGTAVSQQLPLTEAQQQACDSISQQFQSKRVCLLHGVTSSGKTEIYIRLIRHELEKGHQVLYLLPEIALTTQVTTRLRRIFGDKMGVYHSKYPDNERVELWKHQVGNKPFGLILGVRSALFLPFQNLSLIIVDEEHETSYKQQDPAPRYNARDSAIVLSAFFPQAHVLLGTATPSIETYHNAQNGKYGYVLLDKRFEDMLLPKIEIVDIQDLMHRKLMHLPFSPRLEEEINKALQAKEQVILFQNRRGYTPIVECHNCGWVPTCQFCDVSLTYHQGSNPRMVCHYCGSSYPVPSVCPQCGEADLRPHGFGTEKIEEEVHLHFPEARTARLDFDTTRTRNSYEHIINDFAERRTDILIGTQMVSKGLDFDNVHVVGILDADTLLNRPDFRAFERSFQMMSQVAGRAGRRGKQGLVILQTRHKDYPVVQQVVGNDYQGLFNNQEEERHDFSYPPFCRLIYIYLRHKNDQLVGEASSVLASLLRQQFGKAVLGPDRPAIARVQLLYYRKIILKADNGQDFRQVRQWLKQSLLKLQSFSAYKNVTVFFDVDPL